MRLVAPLLLTTIACGLAHAQDANQDATLLASDGAASDYFGSALALDGGRMLVGAWGDDDGADRAGSVYAYELQPDGSWSETDKLGAPTPQVFHKFGISIGLSGEYAVVGTVNLAASPAVPGKVYFYERLPGGTWALADDVAVPAPANTEAVSTVVAIDGERALVGSLVNGDYNYGDSDVDVYERAPDGTWSLAASLSGPGEEPEEWFGAAVDVQGDRALVGAPADDFGGAGDAGAAHVFERQAGGSWALVASLTASDANPGDLFGGTVALDGDRALIGAQYAGSGGTSYVFEEQPDGSWIETAKLSAFGGDTVSGFGGTVDLAGERALVGAPGGFSATGTSYLFRRTPTGWVEDVRFRPSGAASGDRVGIAVRLDGMHAALGADWDDDSGVSSGSAHVVELGSLYHGQPELSVAAGGSQSLLLRAGPNHGGELFLLLGSLSGTTPGTPIPSSNELLPLNYDAYTQLLLATGGGGLVAPLVGALDPFGRADSSFTLPAGAPPEIVGLTAHHAYVAVSLAPLGVKHVSNAVPVVFVP